MSSLNPEDAESVRLPYSELRVKLGKELDNEDAVDEKVRELLRASAQEPNRPAMTEEETTLDVARSYFFFLWDNLVDECDGDRVLAASKVKDSLIENLGPNYHLLPSFEESPCL